MGVGAVPATPATAIIELILAAYQAKGWTREQLEQELAGVIFPSLEDQQDLKKGYEPGTRPWGGTSGGGYRRRYGGGYRRRSYGGGGFTYPRWRGPQTVQGGPFRS